MDATDFDIARNSIVETLDILAQKLEAGLLPACEDCGICLYVTHAISGYNALALWDDHTLFSGEAYAGWSKYSGQEQYPIPATNPKCRGPVSQYHSNDPKWTGEQGQLRRSLIHHLIKYFEGLRYDADRPSPTVDPEPSLFDWES